jgi:hypothetical protein
LQLLTKNAFGKLIPVYLLLFSGEYFCLWILSGRLKTFYYLFEVSYESFRTLFFNISIAVTDEFFFGGNSMVKMTIDDIKYMFYFIIEVIVLLINTDYLPIYI